MNINYPGNLLPWLQIENLQAPPSQNTPTLGKVVYACISMPLCSYVLHYLILAYVCEAFLRSNVSWQI